MTGCCTPKECGGCSSPAHPGEVKKDKCMCGCLYLNGIFQGLMAQFFVFSGWMLSIAAFGDCKFVSLDLSTYEMPDHIDMTDFPLTPEVGFLTYAEPNGDCYWYDDDDGISAGDQLDFYVNTITSDFDVARVFGALGIVLGGLSFFHATSLCCAAHIRPIRLLAAIYLSLFLATAQGLTLLVLSTNLCSDFNCELSRSAWISVGSSLSYFLGGLSFFFLSDYPGEGATADTVPVVDTGIEMGTPGVSPYAEHPDNIDEPVIAHADARVVEAGNSDYDNKAQDGTTTTGSYTGPTVVDKQDDADDAVVASETQDLGIKGVAQVQPDNELQR